MSDQTFLPAWRDQSLGRRLFLRVSAASATSVALIAAGCSTSTPTPTTADPYQLAFPAADSGLLYYTYLLTVALATTYQKVVDAPPADLTLAERAIFTDLRDHEVIHRGLVKYLIDPAGTKVLFPADFAFDTSKFTLTTRAGVLAAAQQLEDLAAAAYAPILPLFTSSVNLTLLLKMSSVQARHAAAVRDLLSPGSFANSSVVDNTGQLITKTPTEVTAALAPYFAPYVLSAASLPVPA